MIWILIANNGEEYENYSEWIGGVFNTEILAVEEGRRIGTCFKVEQWKIGEIKYETSTIYDYCNNKWYTHKN